MASGQSIGRGSYLQIPDAHFVNVGPGHAGRPITADSLTMTPGVPPPGAQGGQFCGLPAGTATTNDPGDGCGIILATHTNIVNFSRPLAAFGASFYHSPGLGNGCEFPAILSVYDGFDGSGRLLGTITSTGGQSRIDFVGLWSAGLNIRSAKMVGTSIYQGFAVDSYGFSFSPIPPPALSILIPTNTAQFIEPATIQASASATNIDGTVNRVEFFANGTLVGVDTNAPFNLTFNLLRGNYSITAVATDVRGVSGTSAPVNITVLFINQAPNFSPGMDLAVQEDSGPQTVVSWASNISPGPPNEAAQSVAFVVTNNNPGLFTVQPTIDSEGNLTFTPAVDAFGDALVTVVLRDDGGTANGGNDTSRSQTFEMRVLPVNDPPVARAGTNQILECAGPLTPAILDASASTDVDSDALAFAWREGETLLGTNRRQLVELGDGTHLIILEVTDPAGALSQDTTVITIQDTSPPSLACPTNITLDATNSAGTAVIFPTMTATDCATNVAVVYTPVSGSTFPIGTNYVSSTATDGSSNSNSCTFFVIVRGPRSIKEAVRAELIVTRADVTQALDGDRLDRAIADLTTAIDSLWWLDENHVVRQSGSQEFNLGKRAVLKLQRIINDPGHEVPDALLSDWTMRLVNADRLLAEIAADEVADDGANARKIAEVRRIIARGDVDAAKGREQTAIVRYHDAWRRAVRLQAQANQ